MLRLRYTTKKAKKIYSVICGKYRRFKNSKRSFPFFCSLFENEEEELIEIFENLGLIESIKLL